MLGFRVPDPDEAMLVSGGKAATGGVPFRVVVGHRAFVAPFINRVSFLSLAMQEAEIIEHCVTQQGIEIATKAVCAFKVANDPEMIVNAGQRFLSDQAQMPVLTGRIFAGHLRSIIGSMTVEQIVQERQKLAEEVLDGSKAEMAKLGLLVDSFQIQSIDDLGAGYIQAMAAPHTAAIQRASKIAQSEADRASAEAQQESQRKQAQYTRETSIAQAQYDAEVRTATANAQRDSEVATAQANRDLEIAKAESSSAVATSQAQQQQAAQLAQAKARQEVATAEAMAGQAGSLAQAKAAQDVAKEQTLLAGQQAELREQQLLSEVVKPAEAEAQRVKIAAEADAHRIEVAAQAAASSNRVSLDQQLIEQLPQLVLNAAEGLSGANLTVLNGTEGLSAMLTGIATEGLGIYNALRNATAQNSHTDEAGGSLPAKRT